MSKEVEKLYCGISKLLFLSTNCNPDASNRSEIPAYAGMTIPVLKKKFKKIDYTKVFKNAQKF
jgi:hypothetical protein